MPSVNHFEANSARAERSGWRTCTLGAGVGAPVLVEEAEVGDERAGEREQDAEVEGHGAGIGSLSQGVGVKMRWCRPAQSRQRPGTCPDAHRQSPATALLAALDPGTLPGRTSMRAKEPCRETLSPRPPPATGLRRSPPNVPDSQLRGDGIGSAEKPLLMVDIDGVISLFGFAAQPLIGVRWRPTARSTRSTAYPTSFRAAAAAAPAGARRRLRSGVGQRLGGEGQGIPAAPARAAVGSAVPALRALTWAAPTRTGSSPRSRSTPARARSRGSMTPSTTPATSGPGALGAHAAGADRPRAGPHTSSRDSNCSWIGPCDLLDQRPDRAISVLGPDLRASPSKTRPGPAAVDDASSAD